MTQSDAMNRDKRLYLDDLHVGQRFTSGTHVIDETQIKAFARQFDPPDPLLALCVNPLPGKFGRYLG